MSMTRRRTLQWLAAVSGVAGGAATAQERTLELGVLPNVSARLLLAQYQPMREFLARRLGCAVQVSTAPNWTSFFQRTAAHEYDLVVTAANMARVGELDSGLVPLMAYQPAIKGLIVMDKSRPLATISELRGKTLALSNPQSLVTLRGMQWLAEQGLKRDVDFRTASTPTDDSVGNLVVRGECFAAMLSGGEFRAVPEEVRNRLAVFVNFADVPGFVLAATPRLDAATVAQLRRALAEFAGGADEGRAFFAATGFSGMAPTSAASMDALDVFTADTRRLFAPAR
jgi:phosphonate transport system substrate-binding protein